MIIGNQGWNKIKQWQRERNYKEHVQRMKLISSPQRRKRSKQQHSKSKNLGSDLNILRSGFKLQQQRKMDLQNHRLLKKLDEIGRRKSKFAKQTIDQKNYYTINIRSRQATRKIKYQQIQQENDLIVERIMRMRSGKGLLRDASSDSLSKKSLKKTRVRRKNMSLILPKLETQIENIQHI